MGSTGSQKGNFQLADTRLVSIPTSSAIAPTYEHHLEAIAILKDEHDGDIFAWLKLARSLEQSLQPRSDHACLTRDQVRAIAALNHYANDDISAWLHLARAPSTFRNLAFSASPHVHKSPATQGHEASASLSDTSISCPVNNSSNHEVRKEAATSLMEPVPTATATPSQTRPKYCCTLCDFFRPFKNQSDWRKHEREHDTRYICMLRGPREATPQGAQCAFCGILYPHDDHLLEHNAQVCLKGQPQSFSSKRRHEMVSHLGKIHGIHLKSQGEAIAVKWKYTLEKQAWSCGFCVKVFVNFNDRLSHIATQHFERGQIIDDWDATKVIQGLLQQSGMTKAWDEKLASLPAWEVPDIIWEKDAIIALQHDLEVGPNDEKSAEDLAEAAYIACRMNWGMEVQPAMAVAEAKSDEKVATTAFLPNQCQVPMAAAPYFCLNHNHTPSAGQEFNHVFSGVPANQTMPLVNYGYSNSSSADLNDTNDIDLAFSQV